jgi:hypothetical protein
VCIAKNLYNIMPPVNKAAMPMVPEHEMPRGEARVVPKMRAYDRYIPFSTEQELFAENGKPGNCPSTKSSRHRAWRHGRQSRAGR